MSVSIPDAHVFYVHSPITYSMAMAAIRHLQLVEPLTIGGRMISGKGIAFTVEDDGIWSPQRACKLLSQIAKRIPSNAKVAMYLPHTAFLFGKLVKLSDRICRIYYLEEGYTSANKSLQNQFLLPTPVDLTDLMRALDGDDLIQAMQINKDVLNHLNEIPDSFFDIHCSKYAGSFSCSPDAFIGMPDVTCLSLDIDENRKSARLLTFFGIFNRYSDANQISHACRLICGIIESILKANQSKQPLLLKLHPRDCQGLPDWFYDRLNQLGADYFDYCHANDINANVEPALLNFDHYYIFGQTAQAKYIEMFLGIDRMTRV